MEKITIESAVEEIDDILYGMNIEITHGEYRRVLEELEPKATKLLQALVTQVREEERERFHQEAHEDALEENLRS